MGNLSAEIAPIAGGDRDLGVDIENEGGYGLTLAVDTGMA
jgi:hypothetical protein